VSARESNYRDHACTLEGVASVTAPLPELLDAAGLQAELGIKRAAAEAIMRQLPVVSFDGLRKIYVRRVDVARLIEERTFAKTEVHASPDRRR
jgi:hypothetical protein